jgi:hypothetical protein
MLPAVFLNRKDHGFVYSRQYFIYDAEKGWRKTYIDPHDIGTL